MDSDCVIKVEQFFDCVEIEITKKALIKIAERIMYNQSGVIAGDTLKFGFDNFELCFKIKG